MFKKAVLFSCFLSLLPISLALWVLFFKKEFVYSPIQQCNQFYTYAGLYKLPYPHQTAQKNDMLRAAQRLQINHIIFTEQFKKNAAYENGVLVISHDDFKKIVNLKEVINLNRLWKERINKRKKHAILSLMTYFFIPERAFSYILQRHSMPQSIFSLSDSKKNSSFSIISAIDIKTNNVLNLKKIPSYKELFGIIKNYIFTRSELTGQVSGDKKKIIHAFKQGSAFIGLDIFGNTREFCAFLQSKNKIWLLGEKVSHNNTLQLVVRVPTYPLFPKKINIYKNDELITVFEIPVTDNTSKGHTQFMYNISQSGRYRVSVSIHPKSLFPFEGRWTPWILTNSFSINNSSEKRL